MIARKQWFTRGKYGGWGLVPSSWQGWVVYGAIFATMILLLVLPNGYAPKDYVYIVGIFILIDAFSAFLPIREDERESQIAGMADKNAARFMNVVLTFAVIYSIYNAVKFWDMSYLNVFAFLALLGGALVKGFTQYYYDNQK